MAGVCAERRAALLLVAGGSALVCAGVALAAPGDPKKDFNPADQATAKIVPALKGDLPGKSWVSKATDFSGANPPCFVKNYSLSALTVNGEAGTTFVLGGAIIVESDAHVFETAAQAAQALRDPVEAGARPRASDRRSPRRCSRARRRARPRRSSQISSLPCQGAGDRERVPGHAEPALEGRRPSRSTSSSWISSAAATSDRSTLIGPARLWSTPIVRVLAGKMAARMAKH